MDNSINKNIEGMVVDTHPADQPTNTYRFALNAVIENNDGNKNRLLNENGTVKEISLQEGFFVIGNCYVGDNEYVLFTVNPDKNISQILVVNSNNKIDPLRSVDDSTALEKNKLNFSINNPIKATYRLRRGCEKIVYWVDGLNSVRNYNLTNKNNYLSHGRIVARKFNLQSDYTITPKINVKVVDINGNLKPGAYKIAVRYVDKFSNYTEWLALTGQINIHHGFTSEDYNNIYGSIAYDKLKDEFPRTSKAIKISLSNLDLNYTFIQYAIICYTNGSGEISEVVISDNISINNNSFVYTGDNHIGTIPKEELNDYKFGSIIASEITQADNRLVLGNISYKDYNFCSLQKYASLITADCIVKPVVVGEDAQNPFDPKNELYNDGHVGYFPGEIYSFGIKYHFEDGTTSPVYHIPGKNKKYTNTIFSPGENVYSMSIDNEIETIYTNHSSCSSFDFWGNDISGETLLNKNVRHHRFPTRKELGIDLIKTESKFIGETEKRIVNFKIKCILFEKYVEQKIEKLKLKYIESNCPSTKDCLTKEIIKQFRIEAEKPLTFNLNYTANNNTINDSISYRYDSSITEDNISFSIESDDLIIDSTKITIDDTSELSEKEKKEIINIIFPDKDITINYDTYTVDENLPKTTNTVYTLGIRFGNILQPITDSSVKIIGYTIVRNERTKKDKTIIDSGVLFPTVEYNNYISCGLLAPETEDIGIDKTKWGFITLEQKFLNKKYISFSEIIQEGEFQFDVSAYGYVHENNVLGEPLDYGDQKMDRKDNDGWSLSYITRDTFLEYKSVKKPFRISRKDILNIEYLSSLEYTTVNDDKEKKLLFNASVDNSLGMLCLKNKIDAYNNDKKSIPYVYFVNKHKTSYSDFYTTPYYNEHTNIKTFTSNISTIDLFSGDCSITPIKYIHSIFVRNEFAYRGLKPVEKKGWWQKIVGGIVLAVGAGLTLLTFGTGLPLMVAGAAIAGGIGLGGIALGILEYSQQRKEELLREAFDKHYDRGLRGTIYDKWIAAFFGRPDLTNKSIFANKVLYKDGSSFKTFSESKYALPYKYPNDYMCVAQVNDNDKTVCNTYMRDVIKLRFTINDGSKQNGVPKGFYDDTILWAFDALSDLWFESTVNASLRVKLPSYLSTFIPAPSEVLFGNRDKIKIRLVETALTPYVKATSTIIQGCVPFIDDEVRKPVSTFETYCYNKLFVPVEKDEKDKSRTVRYLGVPTVEGYIINNDYNSFKRLKPSFMIPLTYDCCSFCKEEFNTRIIWSEPGFSEELSDNFKNIKENNYKDIPGDTGKITNILFYNNNLLIHTEEGLYVQPRNIQERVTDEIVSFVDTGSFASLPAQKIVNDVTGMSVGLQQREAYIVTPYGYVFVSNKEKKVYIFNKGLQVISERGMSQWFANNILCIDKEKNNIISKSNRFNKFGLGNLFGYDYRFNRLLFTQLEQYVDSSVLNKYTNNNDYLLLDNWIFENFYAKKRTLESKGFTLIGTDFINDQKRFIFKKIKYKKTKKSVRQKVNVFQNVDYIVFFYDFTNDEGKTDLDTVTEMTFPIQTGTYGFSRENSNTYNDYIQWSGDNRGSGLESIMINVKNIKQLFPNINEIKFNTGAWWYRGPAPGNCNISAIPYQGGYMSLDREKFVFNNVGGKKLLEKGYVFGNKNISTTYQSENLTRIGEVVFKISEGELSLDGKVGGNIENLVEYKDVEIDVDGIEFEYEYITGNKISQEDLEKIYNKHRISWTISYSFEKQSWISFHSYIPNLYLSNNNKFYSITNDNKESTIWKHNVYNTHHNFYGKPCKFVIEYVDNKNPLMVKLWNHIQFDTDAMVYDEATDSYVHDKNSTFQKAILYNTRQCSGWLALVPKEKELSINYIRKQVNEGLSVWLDKNEKYWFFNDFRDVQNNPSAKVWIENRKKIDTQTFVDKVLNESNINLLKDWTQQERFRDKYMIIRFEFEQEENKDVSLAVNYNIHNTQQSHR